MWQAFLIFFAYFVAAISFFGFQVIIVISTVHLANDIQSSHAFSLPVLFGGHFTSHVWTGLFTAIHQLHISCTFTWNYHVQLHIVHRFSTYLQYLQFLLPMIGFIFNPQHVNAARMLQQHQCLFERKLSILIVILGMELWGRPWQTADHGTSWRYET